MESRSFLQRVHKNSLKSLVASLYDGKGIDNNDLQELRQYVDQISGREEN